MKSIDVPAAKDGESAAFKFDFELPERFAANKFFDVRVSASTWVVDRDAQGVGRLISFGFVRLGFQAFSLAV